MSVHEKWPKKQRWKTAECLTWVEVTVSLS